MNEGLQVFAPGRVSLISEDTDYTGGLVFPMALHLGITISGTRGGNRLDLVSESEPEPVDVAMPFSGRVADVEPPRGRFAVASAKQLPHTSPG